MKVQRIDINIPRNKNQHVQYLYNKALDLMNTAKVGGTISNEGIKVNGLPETFTKWLKEAQIFFEQIKK